MKCLLSMRRGGVTWIGVTSYVCHYSRAYAWVLAPIATCWYWGKAVNAWASNSAFQGTVMRARRARLDPWVAYSSQTHDEDDACIKTHRKSTECTTQRRWYSVCYSWRNPQCASVSPLLTSCWRSRAGLDVTLRHPPWLWDRTTESMLGYKLNWMNQCSTNQLFLNPNACWTHSITWIHVWILPNPYPTLIPRYAI